MTAAGFAPERGRIGRHNLTRRSHRFFAVTFSLSIRQTDCKREPGTRITGDAEAAAKSEEPERVNRVNKAENYVDSLT
jgi:hypothetical protein